MTQEDKELLFKDLCARLPYGIKVHIKGEYKTPIKVYTVCKEDETITYFKSLTYFEEDIENVKSYLRPLSSMTDEECAEFKWLNEQCDTMSTYEYVPINHYRIFDWLNRHHFDYRGLIEKGLAIKAPEEMYNLEKK